MKKKVLVLAVMSAMVLSLAVCTAQAADKTLDEIKAEMRALYGENKRITDGN